MGNVCGQPEAKEDIDSYGPAGAAHVTAIASAAASRAKDGPSSRTNTPGHDVLNRSITSRILRLEKRGGHVNGDVSLDSKSKLAKYFTMYEKLPDDEGASLRAGATWLARSQKTGRLLHLRVLSLPLDFTMVPLVSREIEAVSPAFSAPHPNVVMGKQVMLTDEHFAVVMEVPSTDNSVLTLAKHVGLKKGKVSARAVSEDAARYFFLQLVSAVEHFHSKKLAHRHIDLANCLLDTSTNPPVLKLTDRGYGKTWRVDPRLTYSMKGFKTADPLDLNSSIRSGNSAVRSSISPDGSGSRMDVGLGGGTGSPSACLPLEGDDFCGCSRPEAEAADAFACGASLFAMLLGAYPQGVLEKKLSSEPTRAPELIHDQCVAGWAAYPAIQRPYSLLSADCRDLLERLFDPDEFARMSLAEAKHHRWAKAISGNDFYSSALAAQQKALAATRSAAVVTKESTLAQGVVRRELHCLVWKASSRGADREMLQVNRSGGACPGLSPNSSIGRPKDVETVGLSIPPALRPVADGGSASPVPCSSSSGLALIQETAEPSVNGKPQQQQERIVSGVDFAPSVAPGLQQSSAEVAVCS